MLTTCACTWYFAKDRKNIEGSIARGYFWGLTYHFGSLALGSSIILVAWIIQLIFGYLFQKLSLKLKNPSQNCLVKCAQCSVSVYEKFIRYINRHAYIETVLKSTPFCESASNATSLILKHASKLGVLHGIAELIIIFGVLAISVITTLVCYGIMAFVSYSGNISYESNGPLIVAFIIAFISNLLFAHIFDISADSIVHCYLLDYDQHLEKPKWTFSKLDFAFQTSIDKIDKHSKEVHPGEAVPAPKKEEIKTEIQPLLKD